MKKIKLSQKLSLNKSIVSKLNIEESSEIIGGKSSPTHCFCPPTKMTKCFTEDKFCVVDSVMKTCFACDDISHDTEAPYC